ncbi:MAG: Gfo/Idh/MocA family oxidoreductase [Planctomycetes bacterium]|nr:Gfo/Idh/MocA family oxidoreductase [Planctomycetota bacterium]
MSRALNVALIGQKFMGRAHSNAWAQVNHFFELPLRAERHTLAARDAAELERFARQWGWAKTTTDWRTLAADDEVALVDIGTPNDVHAEPSIAMLEAGKHVACEKPLAGTLADARAMRDAAAKAKKSKRKARTFVWYNYRRCPAVGLAWKLVREGRLGRIYHVRAHYLQSWGGADTPLLWRFQKKYAGTGAHGDLNAHIVDMARFLVGEEVTTIHGAIERTFVKERTIPGTKKKGKSDVDDAVLFLASFAGGASASFEATRLAHGHQNDNSIELNGEKGSLRFSFEDMNVLWFCDGTQPLETRGWQRIMCTSAGGGHPYAKHWWPDAHVLGYEHGFVNMAADIVRVLSGEAPELPLPDFEDAYQTQRVLEAALVSARERTAISLSDVR